MKMHTVNKLQEMKENGGSWQRVDKAKNTLEELENLLTGDEYRAVKMAHGHYLTGEGRVELDQICNTLIRKYRQDTDPRTFTKTLL